MIDTVLADLKSRFGDKVLLSPEDIAPLIASSPAVQANMRSQGRFPIPVKKVGRKIGVSIYHLAEYLAKGEVKTEVQLIEEYNFVPNVNNVKKGNRDWLLAFQQQNNFVNNLFICVEKEILEIELSTDDDKQKVVLDKI